MRREYMLSFALSHFRVFAVKREERRMYTDAHGSVWRRGFQVKFLGHAAFSCCCARSGNFSAWFILGSIWVARPEPRLLTDRRSQRPEIQTFSDLTPAVPFRCVGRCDGRALSGLRVKTTGLACPRLSKAGRDQCCPPCLSVIVGQGDARAFPSKPVSSGIIVVQFRTIPPNSVCVFVVGNLIF
jgi:hypothetical protein